MFLDLICTVWEDWNFIYGVKVSYELHSAILLFSTRRGANVSPMVALFESFQCRETLTCDIQNCQPAN